jgi:hypothetical protein
MLLPKLYSAPNPYPLCTCGYLEGFDRCKLHHTTCMVSTASSNSAHTETQTQELCLANTRDRPPEASYPGSVSGGGGSVSSVSGDTSG